MFMYDSDDFGVSIWFLNSANEVRYADLMIIHTKQQKSVERRWKIYNAKYMKLTILLTETKK